MTKEQVTQSRGASDNVELSSVGSNKEILKALNWLKVRSENAALLVKTYRNGETFYRKYSDGFIIQGGYFINRSTGGRNPQTVTLPISFSNTSYKLFRSQKAMENASSTTHCVGSTSQTKTSFQMNNDSKEFYEGTYWMAFGY